MFIPLNLNEMYNKHKKIAKKFYSDGNISLKKKIKFKKFKKFHTH